MNFYTFNFKQVSKSKIWVAFFLLLHILIIFIVFLINFKININEYFNHSYGNGAFKIKANERYYKPNLFYKNYSSFDTILIGPSSTGYVNTKSSKKYNIFNFSLTALTLDEVPVLINFADINSQGKIKNIFLGLHFYMVDLNENDRLKNKILKDYLSKHRSIKNFYFEITNADGFKQYIDNFLNINNKNGFYLKGQDYKQLDRNYLNNFNFNITNNQKIIDEFERFTYDSKYKDYLKEIVKFNKHKSFIVYLEPVAKPYLQFIIKNKPVEFQRWLNESLEVFGEILVPEVKNEWTENYKNYFIDFRHYYPAVGEELIKNIEDHMFSNKFKLINKNNVNNYIADLKKSM
jgi:hypothetical protein